MAGPAESAYDAGMIRPATLAACLAAILILVSLRPAQADGRADWSGYAWQRIEVADCFAMGSVLHCPPYHEKWDWKRSQWVDIVIEIDPASGTLRLAQRLTDRDRRDDDHVCVTAVAVDAAGDNVVVHHQNWHMGPGGIEEKAFAYRSARLADIAVIHIGSKQCRQGASQDDALHARVLAGIHS